MTGRKARGRSSGFTVVAWLSSAPYRLLAAERFLVTHEAHRRSTASLTYPRRHSTRAGRSTEAELRHEPYTSPRFCHTPSSPSQHSLLARLPDRWRSAYAPPARLNGSVQLRGLRRISGMSRAR